MHILQIYNKIPYPAKDGGSIAVLNMSKGFVKHGHRVDILALNTSKHFINEPEKTISHLNINIECIYVNTKIKPFKLLLNLLFSITPYNAERFISEDFTALLEKNIIKNKYDIIQIEGLYMLPYIKAIRKKSNIPVVYRAHNIEYEIWERSNQFEKKFFRKKYIENLKERIKQFEISYLNSYDYIVPITKRDEDKFNHLGNIKKSCVSPAGINPVDYISTEKKIEDIKLFFLGSLDWMPNIEGLIWFLEDVWKPISKKFNNLRFSIAGRNASPSFIRKIKSYDNIDFFGEIDNAINFIHDHTVMIVPLRSGSGMRVKIIEAMASSKVIITTSLGLEGIDAVNEKDVLIADNTKEFITYIHELIDGELSVKNISHNAKRTVSDKFDNFTLVKKLLEFYKNELNII